MGILEITVRYFAFFFELLELRRSQLPCYFFPYIPLLSFIIEMLERGETGLWTDLATEFLGLS